MGLLLIMTALTPAGNRNPAQGLRAGLLAGACFIPLSLSLYCRGHATPALPGETSSPRPEAGWSAVTLPTAPAGMTQAMLGFPPSTLCLPEPLHQRH